MTSQTPVISWFTMFTSGNSVRDISSLIITSKIVIWDISN